MSWLEGLFWLSSFLVIYPYLIYPLILLLLSKRSSAGQETEIRPKVTLIVSAFNEANVIEQKLDNALSLDYPSDALQVIVVSDGSTDDTAAIVAAVAARDGRVQLLEMESQSGKTAGLNLAVPLATGQVVVFSDANAMYADDALRRLVAPFADPTIGYAVGAALYRDAEQEAVNVSESLYWKYELWIKKLESRFHSVVGGDGAIYAIRRELYQPLSTIDISDFVNPLQIVAAGFRGVFLPDARSYEGGTDEFSDEFRRKRRIVNRSWGAVRRHIGIFRPIRHSRFLFMLVSHKVIRWYSCAFIALALVFGGALALTKDHLYMLLVSAIVLSILTAVVGWRLDKADRKMPKLVYILYYFYLVGLASLLGIGDDLRGRTYSVWTHVR